MFMSTKLPTLHSITRVCKCSDCSNLERYNINTDEEDDCVNIKYSKYNKYSKFIVNIT